MSSVSFDEAPATPPTRGEPNKAFAMLARELAPLLERTAGRCVHACVDDRASKDDVRASAARIRAIIEHERSQGTAADRIVVAGFSQGGAMALHVGSRYEDRLAGLMILSAYLVVPSAFEAERTDADLLHQVRGRRAATACLLTISNRSRGIPYREVPLFPDSTSGRTERERCTFPKIRKRGDTAFSTLRGPRSPPAIRSLTRKPTSDG